MRVFDYLAGERGMSEAYNIYKVVQSLMPLAKATYKGSWEDALDEAFFHILKNYDPSKGDLEHYATRVVGTIHLNKNKKESASTEQAELSLDLQMAKDYDAISKELEDSHKDTDTGRCVEDMAKLLSKDLKFLVTMSLKDKKMSYRRIFERYDIDTIIEAKEYLVNKYQDKISEIVDYTKEASIRDFKEDRYLKSMDVGFNYVGELKGVVLYSKKQGSHYKKIYSVDIRGVLDNIISIFYKDDGFGKISIEGNILYVSMSGVILKDFAELRDILERELVGSLLSRSALKVVKYERGERILLSSTKTDYSEIILPIFNSEYTIEVKRLVTKEVV